MQKWDYLYLELVLNDVEWINGNKIQKIPMFATSHKAWDVLKLLGQDGYEVAGITSNQNIRGYCVILKRPKEVAAA